MTIDRAIANVLAEEPILVGISLPPREGSRRRLTATVIDLDELEDLDSLADAAVIAHTLEAYALSVNAFRVHAASLIPIPRPPAPPASSADLDARDHHGR